jgi:outer membrane protein assembly factor BamA
MGTPLVVACLVAFPGLAYAQEAIAEIRVHGNHTTPDADVLALAGLTVGEPATPARLTEAEERLRASGRFDEVEVRRRSRSISDPSEVLVILLVDERASVSKDNLVPGPLSRMRHAALWLPVLHHRDGYGLTYGARATFVNLLGTTSRISTPLTWGGERRAALEAERSFEGRWITSLRGAASINRRVNPHFDESDTRREVGVQAERAFTPWLRAGARAGVAQVTFAGRDERRRAAGVHLVVDTRVDPSFPRNAVQADVAWERLGFTEWGAAEQVSRPGAAEQTRRNTAGRLTADVRGFLGIGGSAVLAVRGQAVHAGSPLPDFEKALLGGADSVRGYRAGHRAGDRVAAFSAEVRLPLTSPLSVGRFGVKAFADLGAAWAANERLSDRRFDRGIGGGVYGGATAVTANVDVAWPERGKPRVHVGVGLRF